MPGDSKGKGAVSAKEMRTLFVMGIVLIVLVGVLAGSVIMSGGKEKEIQETSDPAQGTENSGIDIRIGDQTVRQIPDPGDPYEDEEPKDEVKNDIKPYKEDPGWDKDTIDNDASLDERGFYHLIHRAATMTDEELHAKVDSRVGSQEMIMHPKELRGRSVSVIGDLLQILPREFPDNPSGVRIGYQAYIIDNHWKTITVYLVDYPEWMGKLKGGTRSTVQVEGLFYKVWVYEDVEGKNVHAPMIIGRTMRKVAKYRTSPPIRIFGVDLIVGGRNLTWGELVVFGLLIVIVPVLFFFIRSERRKFDRFKHDRMEKQKVKLKPFEKGGAAKSMKEQDSEGGSSPEAGDEADGPPSSGVDPAAPAQPAASSGSPEAQPESGGPQAPPSGSSGEPSGGNAPSDPPPPPPADKDGSGWA